MKKFTLFMHTHKCAGTSIIRLFKDHDFVRMPAADGALPPYFSAAGGLSDPEDIQRGFSKAKFEAFVEQSKSEGLNFCATEWIVPPFDEVRHRDDLFTFTVLRDPFERYLSNYHFDIRRGFSNAPDIWRYRSHRNTRAFRQYDYYTRFFASRANRDDGPITDEDVTLASKRLHNLDAVLILEDPRTFELLAPLGIDPSKLQKRKSYAGAKGYPDEFRDFFMQQAARDYDFYAEACEIATQQMTEASRPSRRFLSWRARR